MSERPACPVAPFDRAEPGYSEAVAAWLANPHAYFTAFGQDARAFQKAHRSERLRTMTLVAPAAELSRFTPRRISLDRREAVVRTWRDVFSTTLTRLAAAQPATFVALQAAGELAWLGCAPGERPLAEALVSGGVTPTFASWDEVIARVQWLFLMCGVRLNEAIVQVDPYTDAEWAVRKREIDARRASDKAFMEGRRAAQKAWAESHPDEAAAEEPPARAPKRRFL